MVFHAAKARAAAEKKEAREKAKQTEEAMGGGLCGWGWCGCGCRGMWGVWWGSRARLAGATPGLRGMAGPCSCFHVHPAPDAAPPKAPARTLDNTREWDDTYVDKSDPELLADEADDEFADIFNGAVPPKIMITTKVCGQGVWCVARWVRAAFPRIVCTGDG
jgi:hypothetical protein